jgi:hypothetical protein
MNQPLRTVLEFPKALSSPSNSLIATSRPACDEFLYHSLFGFREGAYKVLNGLDYYSPLRFGPQPAERVEFQLYIRRNANTDLWVIDHLFTRTSAGRGPSDARGLSAIRSSHKYALK